MLGYDTWNALSSGATRVSETLSGAERRKTPATVDIWLDTKLSTASLSSALRWACSKISASTLGNFRHGRELAPIVNRGIVRPNRDTLYSFAVLDFDADPVTVTLADAAKRFMVMPSENHTHPPPMARVKSRSASIAIRVPNGATGLHRVKAKVEKT